MAEILKKLLEIDRTLDFWNIPYHFLAIKRCNADEFASFDKDITMRLEMKSEYVPFKCSYLGTSLCGLFIESLFAVLLTTRGKFSEISDLKQRKAVETLVQFFKNMEEAGNHLKCLKLLQTEKCDDSQIGAVFACHLFSPLLTNGEGEIVIDNHFHGHKDPAASVNKTAPKPECPFCKYPLKTENTNFGVADLWHGRADIVVKSRNVREVVKVTVDEAENRDDNYQLEHGDELTGKKTDLADKDNYCLIEEKTVFDGTVLTLMDKQLYKEAISQTLLNAFLAVKYYKQLEDTFIPSFLVCQKSVFINFYNVKKDLLLVQSLPMKLLPGGVNYAAFFSVWMALNFHVFPLKTDDQFYSTAEKSGFECYLKNHDIYEKYRNDIEDNLSFLKNRQSQEKLRFLIVSPTLTDKLVEKYTKMMKN